MYVYLRFGGFESPISIVLSTALLTKGKNKYSGSLTFFFVRIPHPYLWLTVPDPALFVSELQDTINTILLFLVDDGRIRNPKPYLRLTDPASEGPKTYGSESGTLGKTIKSGLKTFNARFRRRNPEYRYVLRDFMDQKRKKKHFSYLIFKNI
jgi:hypothetical protein